MKHPYDRYFWQNQEFTKRLDFLESQLKMINSIPPSVFDQIEKLDALRNTLPSYYLDAVDQAQRMLNMSPSLDQLQALHSSQAPFLEEFRWRQHDLEILSQEIIRKTEIPFDPPEQRIIDSLVPIEALHNTAQLNEQLLYMATLPQQAFQEFASQQLRLAKDTTSDIARNNIFSIVDSAADLLEDMNNGFRLAVLANETITKNAFRVDYPKPIKTNLYIEIKKDLSRTDLEDPEFDGEDFIFNSDQEKISRLGNQIIQLVFCLNTEAERENKLVIFKPTSKMLLACSTIPTIIATNEESFNHQVDQLFFLLYEGSGSGKRLTEIVPHDSHQLNLLWRLKHLRLSARHDISHGSESNIKKKQKAIGEAFTALINSPMPRTESDWRQAQINLYTQLVEMLEGLWL